MNVQSNWWETFFEGVAVDMWLNALPAEHTEREAESLARMLAVPSGARVLDVPCGGGRLSLALARRGYELTGVDWSAEFLNHARSCDGAQGVTWERRDMRDLPWPARFDGAFCAGNSFGYLDDEGNAAFLRAVAAALKPGARFVLETPMVLENLLGHLKDRPWWKVAAMCGCSSPIITITRGSASTSSTRSCRTAASTCAGGRIAPTAIASWSS